MILLKEITKENLGDIVSLQVADGQKDLILSNAISIAQPYVQPECIPLAIYEDDVPIGFLMHCKDADDDEYWLYRLMIDHGHQGRGLGFLAMQAMLDIVKQDKSKNKMLLGVHRDGGASVATYEKLGFAFNGQVFGKEHIMQLDY